MKQIEEDLIITVNVEPIAISVTSPDLDDTDDILLGVVQASSFKGCDQADVILNLLETMILWIKSLPSAVTPLFLFIILVYSLEPLCYFLPS